MIPNDSGKMPPPMPWITRATISSGSVCESAGEQRAGGEDDERPEEDVLLAEHVAEPAEDRGADRGREQVAGQQPGDAGLGRVQVVLDRRQRRHDRRAEHGVGEAGDRQDGERQRAGCRSAWRSRDASRAAEEVGGSARRPSLSLATSASSCARSAGVKLSRAPRRARPRPPARRRVDPVLALRGRRRWITARRSSGSGRRSTSPAATRPSTARLAVGSVAPMRVGERAEPQRARVERARSAAARCVEVSG